jgi:hypothetical protein
MNKILELYNAREGTSQRTRLDKNLLPENFRIDDRTTSDLVRFAVEFSKSLNYYHPDGSVTQSWEDFFIKERFIFLYIIANTKLDATQKAFYQQFELVSNLTDKTDILSQLQYLIRPIHELLELLATWNSKLGLNDLTNNDLVNISKFVNDENVREDILILFSISEELSMSLNWELIKNNFSMQFSSTSEPAVLENKVPDLDMLKNIFEELYLFAGKIIKFANEKITEKEESNQDVRPHMALFLGFLKVYSLLQDRINGLTKRHLDYYFEEVLKLDRKGITPDSAFVRFELSKDYDVYLLEKDTALIAGKDKSGTPVVYQTLYDTQLSRTKISALYTCFVSRNKLNYTGLENRQEITDIFFKKHDPLQIGSMKVFGEDQFLKAESERTMEIATVGFILASEFLQLSEGERSIYFEFVASDSSYATFIDTISVINQNEDSRNKDFDFTFYQIFSTAFDVFLVFDGAEKKFDQFRIVNKPESKAISLEISVSSGDPAITALKTAQHPLQPTIVTPYVKVLLRDESHIYAYPLLMGLDVINIKLRIEVEGMKNFLLFNNYGQIDHSAPFQFFGAVPKVNSYFLLGSPELFSKPLLSMDINLDWFQLPANEDGWAGYFADYDIQIQNTDYKVMIEYLNSGSWKKLQSKSIFSLFEEERDNLVLLRKLSNKTQLKNLILPIDPSETRDGENFKPYTLKTRNGYIKLELISPDFAFGYNDYSKNLHKSISRNARLSGQDQPTEPNPPISPVVKSISVNYVAETEAISEKGPMDTIHLYCLGPVGYLKRDLKSTERPVKLLIEYKPEGHLMIGLDSYPTDGIITFYFKTQLGNEESYIREVPVPCWQYLENDNWLDMPSNSLLLDNTQGFVQSGIISLKIPSSITNKNTLMNDNLYWVKASVDVNSQIAPEVVGIYTNVTQVRWNKNSDGSHIDTPLPARSINKLLKLNPKIVGVEQVSDSFQGKAEEATTSFYTRVSERLRHKNRAYTNWDYERLLLEEFPFVFKAKCFNAVKYDENNEDPKTYIQPGNLLVVVSPDITNPYITNKLMPIFGISQLIRMRDFLKKVSSPFVNIEVRNPFYEQIRVICEVKFVNKQNAGHYISKLNDDLVAYLTPWTASDETDEQFGGSQYRSKIRSFVSRRAYVEFVTSFSIVKTTVDQGKIQLFDSARQKNNDEVITPEFPWSVLTSVPQHDITVIDDLNYRAPEPRGIENMKLGVDFVIQK